MSQIKSNRQSRINVSFVFNSYLKPIFIRVMSRVSSLSPQVQDIEEHLVRFGNIDICTECGSIMSVGNAAIDVKWVRWCTASSVWEVLQLFQLYFGILWLAMKVDTVFIRIWYFEAFASMGKFSNGEFVYVFIYCLKMDMKRSTCIDNCNGVRIRTYTYCTLLKASQVDSTLKYMKSLHTLERSH